MYELFINYILFFIALFFKKKIKFVSNRSYIITYSRLMKIKSNKKRNYIGG